MKGYILDVNIIAAWFSQNCKVVDRVNELARLRPSPLVQVSAITLGELECGHGLNLSNRDPARIAEYKQFIQRAFPGASVVSVTRFTASYYGAIKAAVAIGCLSERKRVEKWKDKLTGDVLGIDENDLWIMAQAAERNCVLVSHDGMKRLTRAAHLAGLRIQTEDWLS